MLTEQREEVEIRIADDDMAERAQEIGLLMGDEDPRLSQTALAEREAERERISAAAAVPVEGAEGEESEGEAVAIEPEEEEEELDDSAPLVSAPSGRGGRAADDDIIPTTPLGGLRATMNDDGEIIVDEVVEEEAPVAAVEEEDADEGYVLEEDEEFTEPEEEDEGPLVHSTDEDY